MFYKLSLFQLFSVLLCFRLLWLSVLLQVRMELATLKEIGFIGCKWEKILQLFLILCCHLKQSDRENFKQAYTI